MMYIFIGYIYCGDGFMSTHIGQNSNYVLNKLCTNQNSIKWIFLIKKLEDENGAEKLKSENNFSSRILTNSLETK